MKVFVVSIIFLCTFSIKGQTVEEPTTTTAPSSLIGLSFSGNAYPISAIGDVHKSLYGSIWNF